MRLILLLGILLSYATLSFACHTELGDPYIGHHKWSKSTGLLMYTENSTAAVSTSTWCSNYTGFLQQEYEAIAMEAANGEGAHLDIVAAFEGCPTAVYPEFSRSLKSSFVALFDRPAAADRAGLRDQIGKMISANELLRQSCNLHPKEEA